MWELATINLPAKYEFEKCQNVSEHFLQAKTILNTNSNIGEVGAELTSFSKGRGGGGQVVRMIPFPL